MKKFTLFLSFFAAYQILLAQEVFTGTLESWDMGKGDIVTGMREFMVIGSVDEEGVFTIPLDDDYLEKVKELIQKTNENSDWKASLMSIQRAYGNCRDGDVELTNGEQPLMALSTMNTFMIGDLEKDKGYGHFMVASSPEFAESVASFGQKDAVKGYVLDWYYLEEPSTVEGTCTIKTVAQNQEGVYNKKTVYDLNFEKGWNLVKYEYAKLYEDSEGKVYPAEIKYETIDEIPEDVQYPFFAEN